MAAVKLVDKKVVEWELLAMTGASDDDLSVEEMMDVLAVE